MALNRHARAALRELAGGGVTDVTPDELAALHDLGRQYDAAAARHGEPGASVPVQVGNAILWPMTCAGGDWWEMARIWFRDSPRATRIKAFAYGLAHGRSEGALEHASAKDAARDVRRWARSLTSSIDDLDEACALVYKIDDETSADAASVAASTVVDFLRAVGHPRAAEVAEILAPVIDPPPTEPPKPVDPPCPFTPRTYWRGHCINLAAACGGSPDDYMRLSTRDAVRLWTASLDYVAAKSGAKTGPPEAVKNALRALRGEIVAIYQRRKAVPHVK